MVAKVGVILIHLVMIWLGLQLSVGSHVLRGLSVRACACVCVFILGVARGVGAEDNFKCITGAAHFFFFLMQGLSLA